MISLQMYFIIDAEFMYFFVIINIKSK